jgi:hypothetical protein
MAIVRVIALHRQVKSGRARRMRRSKGVNKKCTLAERGRVASSPAKAGESGIEKVSVAWVERSDTHQLRLRR